MLNKETFYQLVESRKSIRQFKPKEIPRDVLERVLLSACHAPSGKNRQNWRFFVLSGQKKEAYLAFSQKSWSFIQPILEKQLKPSLYSFTERFFYNLGQAPVIVFCYSLNTPEEKHLTSIGSVYMAVQNINLSCQIEGLGCCTMGAPLEIKSEVDQFLGLTQLPEYQANQLELLCAVVIGYPDHEPPKAPRKLEGRITFLTNLEDTVPSIVD